MRAVEIHLVEAVMETHPLSLLLSRFWWLLLLRGLLAILFGISAFVWPGLTLVTLVILFAAYAFVDGIFEVVHAISHRREIEHWGLLLIVILIALAIKVRKFGGKIGHAIAQSEER